MIIIMLVLGVFIMAVGLLLLIAPKAMARANEILSKIIFEEKEVFTQRILLAIVCISVGGLLVLTYLSYAWK